MTYRVKDPSPDHEALFQEVAAVLKKYSAKLSKEDVLAITAQIVGMSIALQDQRTMSVERAFKIVEANIEAGNLRVVDQLRNTPAARA